MKNDDTPVLLCLPPKWYKRTVWIATLAALLLISIITTVFSCVFFPWVCLLGAAVALVALALMRLGGGKWVTNPPAWMWLVGVLMLGGVLRIVLVTFIPYIPCADFQVYHLAGKHMADVWTLGTPGSYRCFFPPGQVFSLGVVYRIFNYSILAGQLLNVAWMLITIVGIWYIGRKMFGEWVGRTAAMIVALLPSTIFGCMLLGAEVPETVWLVLALCFYVGFMDTRGSLIAAILCGLCLGIGSYIRPTYILLPAIIGIHMLISWSNRRRALVSAVLMGLATAAVILPWTYRNYCVTGGFVLMSSNGGGNLYSANNDEARGDYTPSAWEYLYANSPDDLTLQRLGKQKAVEWIKANPQRFAWLSVRKFVGFWYGDHEIAWWALEQQQQEHPELGIPRSLQILGQGVSTGFYAVCIILAAICVVRIRGYVSENPRWMIIPILCIYFTAIHMVFEAQSKYHFMLVPLICILSTAALKPKSKSSVGMVSRKE